MSHLGDRIPAFVDGQLTHDVRDRVLAHLTGCAACRAEADAERAVKARLAALVGPAIPDDLTRRLLRLAEPGGPLPPRRRPVGSAPKISVPAPGRPPAAPGRPPGAVATVARPPLSGRARALVPLRPRMPYLAAGSIGAMALALGAALLAGEPDEQGPALVPAVDRFAVEHASTVGELPLLDPAMAVQLHVGAQSAQGTTTAVTYGGYGNYAVAGVYLGEVPQR